MELWELLCHKTHFLMNLRSKVNLFTDVLRGDSSVVGLGLGVGVNQNFNIDFLSETIKARLATQKSTKIVKKCVLSLLHICVL